MGVLNNQRHELFARALAEGRTNSEAYVSSGYAANDGNASTLAHKPSILNRVKEIKGRAVLNTEVTLKNLIEDAGRIQSKAEVKGNFNAAITALTAKAKLAGLWVERGEQHSTVESIELTNEERMKMLEELLAKAK